jgi:all-trans-8'-apo-beta-carotenal 15,15'-oxygenase
MQWRPAQGNLVLVIPREGDATPLQFTTEATWMWHTLNAYEHGDEIIVDFVGYDNPTHFLGEEALFSAIMVGRQGQWTPGSVRRYRINLNTRSLRQEVLAAGHYEFPIVNPHHACHAHRYGYLARGNAQSPFWSQVVRLDTETGKTDSYDFGDGVYCAEPIFAPEPGYDYRPNGDEEPGWVLTEAYDGRTRRSFLAILRADRLAEGPVAVAHLRHHVPLSFHGYWQGLESAPRQNAKG